MDKPNAEQTRWNRKYSAFDPAAPDMAPSSFLKEQEPLLVNLPKGTALDIACGRGRNSFYLASLGFEVDAVDISDVVTNWLAAEATSRQAAVNPVQLDLTAQPFPQKKYQVIINFRYLQRDLFPAMMDALLPGGLLIFETMHRDHVDQLGHQMNPDFLLGDNELLDAFRSLRILRYEEGVRTVKDTGQQTAMASLVATKSG